MTTLIQTINTLAYIIQMISLWRDPQGEKVFITDGNTEIPNTLGDKTKIAQLEKEILSLKQQLKNSNDVRNNQEFIQLLCFHFILQQTQSS